MKAGAVNLKPGKLEKKLEFCSLSLKKKRKQKKIKKQNINHVFEEIKRDPCMQLSDCLSWKHVKFKN